MKNIIIYSTLFAFISFYGCDPVDTISVTNYSQKDVFVLISFDQKFTEGPIKINSSQDTMWNKILYMNPKGNLSLPVLDTWKGKIEKQSPYNTITFFFFERNLLDSIPEEELIKNQIFSSRLILRSNDLKKLNNSIHYR